MGLTLEKRDPGTWILGRQFYSVALPKARREPWSLARCLRVIVYGGFDIAGIPLKGHWQGIK
jgi:hypothetical protein